MARLVLLRIRMSKVPEHVVALSQRVIGCGITVHKEYGPGLLESIYSECMVIELRREGLEVETGRRVPLVYRGQRINQRLELDLVVENSIVVELKAVERMHPVFQAQLITYLKLTGCPLGLLMNFNARTLVDGLRKVLHPDLYERWQPSARVEPVGGQAPDTPSQRAE